MAKRTGGESLAVDVYDQLRADIFDCRFSPGERLKPSELGARFGVSISVMREALGLIRQRAPDLEVDGEMHADAALSEALRNRLVSDGRLTGSANLLIMPTLDAANIGLTLLSAATEALLVGPLLLGVCKPIHVLVPSVTARGIVNMTALAVAQANREMCPVDPPTGTG